MENTCKFFVVPASSRKQPLIVLLKLLIFLAIYVQFVGCVPLEEIQFKIPALGRNTRVGFLYDARSDNFIDMSIFKSNLPSHLLTTTQTQRMNTQAQIIKKESDKFKLFGVVGLDTAASIQTGIVRPEGAASALSEDLTSSANVTGIFLQTFQTADETLLIFNDELKQYFSTDAELYVDATHVVTGVSWGGSIAVKFTDTHASKSSADQSSNILKQEFSKLRRTSEVLSNEASSLKMELTSDFSLTNPLPTTLLEVREQINYVQESMKVVNSGLGIPLKFTLTPISILKKYLKVTSTKSTTAHKVDAAIFRKYSNVMNDITGLSKDFSRFEEAFNCVSKGINKVIENLHSNFSSAEEIFSLQFKEALLGVKSGLLNNSALSEILKQYQRHDFSPKNVRSVLTLNAQAQQKVDFCSQLNGEYPEIKYFGSASNLILKIYQTHNKPTYVLFTKSEFKENDRVLYEDNLNIFLNLLYKPSNALFIVDCDFSYAQCESMNGTVIKQIRQGNYTFDDVRLEIKITEMENETKIVNCNKQAGITGALCVSTVEGKSAKQKGQTFKTNHRKPTGDRLRKVVGGTAAAPNEFPFQVLFLKNATDVHCGGTILDENFILTAAHCLYEKDGYKYEAEEYKSWKIVAGEHNRGINEGTEQRRHIRDVQIHEKYIPIAEINDIAIVELDRPLNLSAAVQPILLPDADYEAIGDAVVTGWGQVRFKGSNPLVLQKVTVPIVDREECVEAYAEPQVFVSVKMLCAGDVVKGDVDSCQGDSGGPLSVKLDNGSSLLVGVVSGGIECARAEYPGIYMQVSKYVQWISDTLNNFSNCSLHNECLNGGTCVDGFKSHSCICAVGYEGPDCATVTNNCAPSDPCLNGGTCVNGINSYTCSCTRGFTGLDCQHVSECAYPGTCKSLPALGNCRRCRDGFVKDPEDDTRCKYANSNASLIISSYAGINMISVQGQKTTQIIRNADSVRGTDYNFRTNEIFWFSYSDDKIYSAPINGESAKKSIFHDSSSDINGIAVDWIHQHLYWGDARRENICVSNFNGTMKKVLFSDGLLYPRLIAVNPLNGWMFWSDNGKHRIERAGLDGSRRHVIFNTNIEDPTGLVVDFVDSRLFWTQGIDPSSIWSSDFDGSSTKLILSSNPSQFPESLFWKVATFDKYVYFIEGKSDTIFRVNKCIGNELQIVHKFESGLWDIKIYDATLQPEGENLCSKRIGRCSHFCFPVPSPGNGSVSTTTCACPDGLSISSDQQNCA